MNAITPIETADPRAELAAAIRIRDAVSETAAAATKSLTAARAFLADLSAKVQAFADLDRKVAAERAAALKDAMAKGEQPRFETSPTLAAALAEKIDADNQLTAANAAIAELEAEAAGHGARLKECEDEIGRKVECVVQFVADEMAAQIVLLETRALDIRAALDGMPRLTRVDGIRSVLYRISEPVRRVIETSALTEIGTPNMPRNLRAKASVGAWRTFADALRADPSAIFNGGTTDGHQ